MQSNTRTILFILLLALLSPPLAAKSKTDTANRGRIILAGVVTAPYNQNGGGSELAEGIGGVPGVDVEIVGTDFKATTDKNGLFFFTKGPKGNVALRLSKTGFKTQTRKADVDPDSLQPTTLRVEMLPDGMISDGQLLTGTGVLYIAYSAPEADSPPPSDSVPIYEMINEIVNGREPLEFGPPEGYDPNREANPYTMRTNHLMVYPAATPSRTTFHFTNQQPYYLAFDAAGDSLYVADNTSMLGILDANNRHKRVGVVPIPGKGRITSLRRGHDGKHIFATVMGGANGVFIIDTAAQQGAAFLPLELTGGAIPKSVTQLPDGSLLVVASRRAAAGDLLVVNPYTGQTVNSMPVGQLPVDVGVTPNARWAYVANSQSGNVSVVDLVSRQTVGTIPVGVAPQSATVTPDGQRVLVANQNQKTVTVIDIQGQRVVATVEVGNGPTAVTVTPDGKTAYVANKFDRNISTIDLDALRETHRSDSMPRSKPVGIALRP